MASLPVIAIVGAGAVGGYYGAKLAHRGQNVHFLLRSDYETVRHGGWVIESCDGNFSLPAARVHVYNDPTHMPHADVVIVTLKTTANDKLGDLIGPLVKQDTCLLTLQNGLGNEERLAALFGAGRVLGGIAFTCINRAGPGRILHATHGHIRIGEFAGDPSPRVLALSDMFNAAGIRCDVLDSLMGGRWEKLVWNIPFNGLGAVLDWTTDRILATEHGCALVTALMAEVVAAANALGHAIDPGIIHRQIESTREMAAYATSMQIDRQQHRPLEVEAILGEPLRRARAAGVATPNLGALYELARMVDVDAWARRGPSVGGASG